MMRRPSSVLERDESVGAKWQQLRQYEESSQHAQVIGDSQAAMDMEHQQHPNGHQDGRKQSTREKLEQFKKNSARRFSSIKSHIYNRYRKGEAGPGQTGSNGTVSSQADYRGAATDVSWSPAGTGGADGGGGGGEAPSSNNKGLGAAAANVLPRLKNSRSLQSLEQITKDGLRNMADKTSNFGQNLKHRYGSRVELNRLAPKRFYEEFSDDVDSDEENRARHDEVF